jgi:hypothetical protein
VILFVNPRSARYEYHTHEKSVRFARRALSASLSWGKHRLAQEAGLFRDVLLHRSIVTEIPVFFQWYLLITVITYRYEPVCIRRSWRMLTRFLIVRNVLSLSGRLPDGWSGLEGPDPAGHARKCSVAPDYPCSKKLRLSKYSQTPRCPCIPGRRRPFRSRRSRPSRNQRQILYPLLCSVLRKFRTWPRITSINSAFEQFMTGEQKTFPFLLSRPMTATFRPDPRPRRPRTRRGQLAPSNFASCICRIGW